jgi:uncharacterized membrane protein
VGAVALAVQVALWFLGAGSRDAHWLVAPVWILAAVLGLRYGGGFAGAGLFLRAGLPGRVTSALVALFGLAWAAALARMFLAFRFGAYDLGIYSSVAFNTAHGMPFFSSVQQLNHLGEHFSPVVAVFAPLYRVAPTPVWLLAAGLAAYLSVPWILQRLVRDHGLEERLGPWIGPLLALLWFLNRPMAGAVEFLFHPSTLAAPFVLLAWDAAARRRWGRLAVWLVFLLLFKESLALAAAGIGLWLLARRDTRRAGAIVLVAGLAAGAALAGWFIPMMRGGEWAHAERLAPLADLPAKAAYVALLLLPFGFLHLRGRALLPALPLVLLNVATGFAPQYGMAHHYDDTVVPLLFAGILGALADGARPFYVRWRAPVAIAAAALCILAPLGPSPTRLARVHRPDAGHAGVRAGLRALQADPRAAGATLAVQSHLDPFVQRTAKTAFERLNAAGPPPGTWAVLSPHAPAWPDASFGEALGRVARSRRFEEVPGFPGLRVFRVRDGQRPPPKRTSKMTARRGLGS